MGIKKEYAALDMAKWVAAILVVSIHAPPLYSASNIGNFILMQIVARFAVPFFFLTSGFLFFSKLSYEDIWCRDNWRRLFHYTFNLLRLYLIWSALYLPIPLLNFLRSGGSVIWEIKILVRSFLFAGIVPHLWYFTAVIVATCVLFLLLKWFRMRAILAGSIILYLLSLTADSYSFLIKGIPVLSGAWQAYEHIFVTTNNGFFFGLLFVAAGACISQKRSLWSARSCWQLFTAFSGCFAMEALFVFFLADGFDGKSVSINRWIFLVPAVVCLFMALLQTHIRSSGLTRLMRSMSIVIYLIHPMILTILEDTLPSLGLRDLQLDSLPYFALTLLLSLIIAWIIAMLEKRSRIVRTIFG